MRPSTSTDNDDRLAPGELASSARAAAVAAGVLLADDGWPNPDAALALARQFAAVLLAHAAEAGGRMGPLVPPDLDAATWILAPERRPDPDPEERIRRAEAVMRDSAATCRTAWASTRRDPVEARPMDLGGFMVQALLESLRRAAEVAGQASNQRAPAAARRLRRLAGEVLNTAVALSVAAGDGGSLATCLAARICAQVPTAIDGRLLPAVIAVLEHATGSQPEPPARVTVEPPAPPAPVTVESPPPAVTSPAAVPSPAEVPSPAAAPRPPEVMASPVPSAPPEPGRARPGGSSRATNLTVLISLAVVGLAVISLAAGMLGSTLSAGPAAAPPVAVRAGLQAAGTPSAPSSPSPGAGTRNGAVDPRRATIQLEDLPAGYALVQAGPATLAAGAEQVSGWDVVYEHGGPATAGFQLVESISILYPDPDRAAAAFDAQAAREVAAGAESRPVPEFGKDASFWIESSASRPQTVLVRVLLRTGSVVGVIGVVSEPGRGLEIAVEQARAQLRRSAAG